MRLSGRSNAQIQADLKISREAFRSTLTKDQMRDEGKNQLRYGTPLKYTKQRVSQTRRLPHASRFATATAMEPLPKGWTIYLVVIDGIEIKFVNLSPALSQFT